MPFEEFQVEQVRQRNLLKSNLQHFKKARDRVQREARAVLERQAKRMSRGQKNAPHLGLPKVVLGMMKRRAEGSQAKLREVHSLRLEGVQKKYQQAQKDYGKEWDLKFDVHLNTLAAQKVLLRTECLRIQVSNKKEILIPSFQMRAGQRWGLVGPNGSGKSSLLKLISEPSTFPFEGQLQLSTAKIFHWDQDMNFLDSESSVLENLKRLAFGDNREESFLRKILARIGFPASKVFLKVKVLSGGERVKLALGAWFVSESPDLVLLDEPNQHLDLESQKLLVQVLRELSGALMIVCHDQNMLKQILGPVQKLLQLGGDGTCL